MLEQLIEMATKQLGQEFEKNENIPHEEFDYKEAASTVGSSVFETISNQVSGGNLGGLTEMLSGSTTGADNPIVSNIATSVITNLTERNGISPQMASTIASVAVPIVMNMFNKQAGAAQTSGVDIGGLITGALAGGGSQGGGGGLLGGLLGKVLGGSGGSGNQAGGIGGQVLTSVLGQLLK